MTLLLLGAAALAGLRQDPAAPAQEPARTTLRMELPPPLRAEELLPDSPFGINTAVRPDTPDLEARVRAMQQAGIKWGRQSFPWKDIERRPGAYDFEPYERLVEFFRRHGILLAGNLTGHPDFHDPRTPQGAEAYAAFARAAAKRFAGRVDHWQIWNEPNGGYWKGTPEEYARLLAAVGRAIKEVRPEAKVLGLNMAFCDVRWAERILRQVPPEAFDIVCFHPYRAMNAPEEPFDWWMLDQYVKSWHPKDLTPEYPLVRMDFLAQLEELRRVVERYGPSKPFWITEICWNTDLHPYGVSELRSAELMARFHLYALASRKVEKIFWYTLKDHGPLQFDKAQMVGLLRADLSPKYSYYAYAVMTRLLEGKRWVRNDAWGPDVYAAIFTDDTRGEDTLVAWTPKNYAYIRVPNTEKGLVCYDLYGTRRLVAYDRVRTGHNPFPLGQSPIYIVGPRGLRASIRPDPGW